MTRLGTGLFPRGPLSTSSIRFTFRALYPGTRNGALLFHGPGFSTLFPRTPVSTVFSRGAFQSLTREGTRLYPRGPLGSYMTRISIASNNVDLALGHLTFTPIQSFEVLRGTIIELPSAVDESFSGGATFTVSQGGFEINLPVSHLTFTVSLAGTGFSVNQTNSGDHSVDLPLTHLTFTPTANSFSVIYQNTIDLPVGRMQFTEHPIDISITLPGQQTLTQTDILAIWNNISIHGFTPQQALEIISAAVAGRTLGTHDQGALGTIVFRSIDDTHDVITATVDPHDNRVNIVLTP